MVLQRQIGKTRAFWILTIMQLFRGERETDSSPKIWKGRIWIHPKSIFLHTRTYLWSGKAIESDVSSDPRNILLPIAHVARSLVSPMPNRAELIDDNRINRSCWWVEQSNWMTLSVWNCGLPSLHPIFTYAPSPCRPKVRTSTRTRRLVCLKITRGEGYNEHVTSAGLRKVCQCLSVA